MNSPINLYWWSPIREPRDLQWLVRTERAAWRGMSAHRSWSLRNFGDELSRLALAEATGRAVRWASPGKADVFGIGSILHKHHTAGSDAVVWGSGSRTGLKPDGHSPRMIAVRGELTRDLYGGAPDLPLGDPGLLARALFAAGAARGSTVLVPHYSIFGTTVGRSAIQAASALGMKVVPPTMPVDMVCQTIADARLVISSSLHGLIVGHATGTPTILTTFGRTTEPDFKYHDYMSPFDRAPIVVPMTDILRDGASRWEEAAVEEVEAVSPGVDRLVEGLIKAAGSIR